MTCSARCSGSSRRAVLLAALAVAASSCGHRAARAPGAGPIAPSGEGAEAPARLRVVLLPVDNLTGAQVPVKELGAAVEAALRGRFELVVGAELESFLVRHRLRYTGGIDAETARAAREELGVDAILITSLQSWKAASPPALALAMRLVTTGNEPTILWMDQASRAGDQSPGLLGLGIIDSLAPIQAEVIARLRRSLEDALERGRQPARCGGGLWYKPRVRYRAPMLDRDERYMLAVVPFFDRSGRRGAGDVVALEVVRQLVATGRYRVLEPGVVRDFLLKRRVIMPGGVSLETTRLLLGGMGVELVVSGTVLDYSEGGGAKGPSIRFTMMVLDGGSGDVVWHSGSANSGDDGVFFFGLGRIATAQALACRMVGGVVDQLTRGKSQPTRTDRTADPVRAAIERRPLGDGAAGAWTGGAGGADEFPSAHEGP